MLQVRLQLRFQKQLLLGQPISEVQMAGWHWLILSLYTLQGSKAMQSWYPDPDPSLKRKFDGSAVFGSILWAPRNPFVCRSTSALESGKLGSGLADFKFCEWSKAAVWVTNRWCHGKTRLGRLPRITEQGLRDRPTAAVESEYENGQ